MFRIFDIFSSKPNLVLFLVRIPVVVIAFTIHEMSHAYAAHKLGDDTAKNLGRLTLNPLKHLDPIGCITLLLFGIGWAKPVPVMTRNFENPKKGMLLTSLAGPLSNIILSLIGLLLSVTVSSLFGFTISGSLFMESVMSRKIVHPGLYLICLFFYLFHWVNLSLAIFNLIPVPPLDGSRIALIFLPEKAYFGIMRYERYIMIGFLILMYAVGFSWLGTAMDWVSGMLFKLVSFIPGLGSAVSIPDVTLGLLSLI